MRGYRERESIVPMDFEYDDRVGPVDAQSPFIAHTAHSAKKRMLPQSQSETQIQKLNQGPPFGHPITGTHSVFDSPSKHSFATPNHPKLSEPHGQSFLFSHPPQTPQSRSVWELRTPQSIADSSGGETPTHPTHDTPAHGSDAATPDTQLALTMGALTHGDRRSPSKRASFLKNLPWNKSPSKDNNSSKDRSPSKDKSAREKPYSKKAENRVMKRRLHKSRARHDDDDDASPTKDALHHAAPSIGFVANIPGFMAWLEAHPGLPHVLSYYLQFLVNAIIGFGFLYMAYSAYAAVTADVDLAASAKAREIMHEMAICNAEYKRNGCEPSPMPALESMCQNWKRCMDRDAFKVARASVGARTFASIFNSFTEEFSYKSLLFVAIVMLGSVNLSNWAFGIWREKAQPHPQHNEYPRVPQTPQRHPNDAFMVDNNTRWHTPAPYMTQYANMDQRPMLQHAQSMPAALPSTEEETLRSPSKKAIRR